MSIFHENDYEFQAQIARARAAHDASKRIADELRERNQKAVQEYARYSQPEGDVIDVEARELPDAPLLK